MMYSISEKNVLYTHCKRVVVAVRLLSYKCLCKEFFLSVFLVDVLLSLLGDTQRAMKWMKDPTEKVIVCFTH